MDDASYFPTDAFAEILLRLPPSSRRRLRLVCRHWRDVIDERTPEKRSRPKPLAFVTDYGISASAYVIDDLPNGPCRVVWTDGVTPGSDHPWFPTELIGTCNGLLCLYNMAKPAYGDGGALFLVNPITGETLALPQLPRSIDLLRFPRHEACSFGFPSTTGQYKIVHIPCYLDLDYQSQPGQFNDVQMLTLGDAASWRHVPAPPRSTCCLISGIIIVDGTLHWVTKDDDARRLASFELKDESFTSTIWLPGNAGPGYFTRLTVVRGRLGIVYNFYDRRETEVWVLDDGGKHEWCLRYRVLVHGPRHHLSQPHFVHGDYMLTNRNNYMDYEEEVILRHTLSGDGKLPCHVVQISEWKPGTAVASFKGQIPRIFAYVETMEPLSVYRLGD